MKAIFLKLILAVVLTIAVISVYSKKEEKQTDNNKITAEKTSVIKNENKEETVTQISEEKKPVFIDTCVKEAVNKGIAKNIAENTCKCFLAEAENNYPKEKITSILLADANVTGTDNEKAKANIIKTCTEKNKTISIDKPEVNVIVGDDKAVPPKLPDNR